MIRAVLFRLAELFRENQAFLAQQTLEPCVSEAPQRVALVGEAAATNKDLKALVCFCVKTKDEAGSESIRWIFAP